MHIINHLNIKLKHNKKLNLKKMYQIDTIKHRKFFLGNQNQNQNQDQTQYLPNLKHLAIKKLILGN